MRRLNVLRVSPRFPGNQWQLFSADSTVRTKKGKLYVVATPIGNLEDMTVRGLKILQSVDFVAAEDTRHTVKLLSALNIQHKPLLSCHEHSSPGSISSIVSKIVSGSTVALVSDAGTPIISDPGQALVSACVLRGVAVSPIPGPSAVTAALSVSGFKGSTEEGFVFVGFAPRALADRTKLFNWILIEPRAVVVFEAPTRVEGLLLDLCAACMARDQGLRRVCVGRELTKMHEEVFRGSVVDAVEWVKQSSPKGEYVIVLEGAKANDSPDPAAAVLLEGLRIVDMLVSTGVKTSEAIKRAAAVVNVPKSDLYDAVVKRKQ